MLSFTFIEDFFPLKNKKQTKSLVMVICVLSASVAGILGYAVGKASYVGTCKEKFQKLGPDFSKGFGPGWGPWSGPASCGCHGHR